MVSEGAEDSGEGQTGHDTRGHSTRQLSRLFKEGHHKKKKKPRALFWTKRDREANSQMHYEYRSDAKTKNSAVRDSFKSTE